MCNDRPNVLNWRVALTAAILLIASGLSYSGDAPPDDWKAPPRFAKIKNPVPADAASIDAGKTIYLANCMACHGVDGTGNALRVALPTIPDMTDATWQKTQTDENFASRIRDGKMPAMPTFKDKLNADQIHALVAYMRAFSTKDTAAK